MPENSKLVDDIMTKVNAADNDISEKRDLWLEYYKLYRNFKDEVSVDGRSNVGLPLAFEWVEVVLSRLFDVFAGKRPYIRVRGREPMDDPFAEPIQIYQNYQYDLAGYKKMMYDVLHQVLIYGTGIVKYYWKYRTGDRTVMRPILPEMPEMGVVPMREEVPIYDNVAFEVVDVFDFSVDPASTIEEAAWCCHKTHKTEDYLKEMQKLGIYSNIDEVIREHNDTHSGGGHEDDSNKQARVALEGHKPDFGGLLPRYLVREYCTDERIITIADDKFVIRNVENKYHAKPYLNAKIISTPHEFYGISLIESGAQMAKVMEDLVNNALDNQNMGINKLIGVDELRVDDTELVAGPNRIFHTRGNPADAIYEFQFSDLAPSVIAIMNIMNDFAKKGTGVVDYLVGQATSGKTATEASLMTNEAAKRIGLHIQIFGDTLVGPLAKAVHNLNRQFQVDEKVVRVTGIQADVFDTVRVTPDVFGAEVDFIWEHEDRALNNMVAVQQLTQLLSISAGDPVLFSFKPTIFKKLLEKFDLHENDELMQAVKIAESMVPIMQQVAITQGMSQGINAGGGIPNAEKVTTGSEGNISQSVNKKTNPQYGSVMNVGG